MIDVLLIACALPNSKDAVFDHTIVCVPDNTPVHAVGFTAARIAQKCVAFDARRAGHLWINASKRTAVVIPPLSTEEETANGPSLDDFAEEIVESLRQEWTAVPRSDADA